MGMIDLRGLLLGLILGSLTSLLILQHINTKYVPHVNHVYHYLEATLPGKNSCETAVPKVRVSVFILTTQKSWPTKGIAVQRTWAKRFDHYTFLYSSTSSKDKIPQPVIEVSIKEGREHLTAKTMQGFLYLYQHYLNSSDWFMKADDDTYIIVENLRLFLTKFNPTEPIIIGFRFWHEQSKAKSGHMSGGAGYVLSKAALILLVEKGFKNPTLCTKDGGSEDVIMSACLHNLGVKFYDAFDLLGNTRFHPFDPLTLLNGLPTTQGNFRYRNIFGSAKFQGALSTESITFHYVNPGCMYMYDFLIYDLKGCVKT